MTARFIVADVFDGLATLEDGSVDLVVTSPPFLALRSYLPADHADKSKEIGSESTPAEFIDVLLKVTAELRRVLAPHGSICIELGDTYAGGGSAGWHRLDELPGHSTPKRIAASGNGEFDSGVVVGGDGWPLSKSRTLIPSLYEIALAYGINPLTGTASPAGQWRIRNIITWARPNPPVGALGDKWRPATSDLIVACTSSKRYWDDLATRKEVARPGQKMRRMGFQNSDPKMYGNQLGDYDPGSQSPNGAPLLDYWEIPLLEGEEEKRYGPKPPRHLTETIPGNNTKGSDDLSYRFPERVQANEAGAPLLDYWVIPPGGYQGAHYAVFPQELVVPCVQAMAPPKVCQTCGQPSRRIVKRERINGADDSTRVKHANGERFAEGRQNRAPEGGWEYDRQTLGFTDCGHGNYRPALILDPFAGSGTTLAVATGFGHDAIGIDIDERNRELARDRVGPFLFETVEV